MIQFIVASYTSLAEGPYSFGANRFLFRRVPASIFPIDLVAQFFLVRFPIYVSRRTCVYDSRLVHTTASTGVYDGASRVAAS